MDTNADRLRKPASGAAIARVPVEERYRILVDTIQDYTTFLLDPTGHITSQNADAQCVRGYRADEIIGQHFSVFYSAEATVQNCPGEKLKRAAALGHWEGEGWCIRKDDSHFWANMVITTLRDEGGDLIGFTKVTRNLTGHEQLKQFKYASELASRVEATREEEKKRIAREFHDDLEQRLTALKMIITGLLADNSTTSEAPAYACEGTLMMSHAIDHTPASVRRLATGLRPTILDDLGLLPTLNWLVTDFGQHTGLWVALIYGAHTVAFNDTTSIALFRIVQEGLTSVARHTTSATRVAVDLRYDRTNCELAIHNDGTVVTCSTKPTAGRPPSSGIASIRERMHRPGGTFTAGPLMRDGYRIQFSIPRKAIVLDVPSGQ